MADMAATAVPANRDDPPPSDRLGGRRSVAAGAGWLAGWLVGWLAWGCGRPSARRRNRGTPTPHRSGNGRPQANLQRRNVGVPPLTGGTVGRPHLTRAGTDGPRPTSNAETWASHRSPEERWDAHPSRGPAGPRTPAGPAATARPANTATMAFRAWSGPDVVSVRRPRATGFLDRSFVPNCA